MEPHDDLNAMTVAQLREFLTHANVPHTSITREDGTIGPPRKADLLKRAVEVQRERATTSSGHNSQRLGRPRATPSPPDPPHSASPAELAGIRASDASTFAARPSSETQRDFNDAAPSITYSNPFQRDSPNNVRAADVTPRGHDGDNDRVTPAKPTTPSSNTITPTNRNMSTATTPATSKRRPSVGWLDPSLVASISKAPKPMEEDTDLDQTQPSPPQLQQPASIYQTRIEPPTQQSFASPSLNIDAGVVPSAQTQAYPQLQTQPLPPLQPQFPPLSQQQQQQNVVDFSNTYASNAAPGLSPVEAHVADAARAQPHDVQPVAMDVDTMTSAHHTNMPSVPEVVPVHAEPVPAVQASHPDKLPTAPHTTFTGDSGDELVHTDTDGERHTERRIEFNSGASDNDSTVATDEEDGPQPDEFELMKVGELKEWLASHRVPFIARSRKATLVSLARAHNTHLQTLQYNPAVEAAPTSRGAAEDSAAPKRESAFTPSTAPVREETRASPPERQAEPTGDSGTRRRPVRDRGAAAEDAIDVDADDEPAIVAQVRRRPGRSRETTDVDDLAERLAQKQRQKRAEARRNALPTDGRPPTARPVPRDYRRIGVQRRRMSLIELGRRARESALFTPRTMLKLVACLLALVLVVSIMNVWLISRRPFCPTGSLKRKSTRAPILNK